MSIFETLRRWVDGEDNEDALGKAAVEQAKPRRQAEEFIVKIARSIGEVMQAEAVPLPPDKIVIPPEYIVFLSEEDDREWQGMKRRALEQGLYHVLTEHARDLAGKTKLATESFSVELRVDGTLDKNEVRVQHSWEETASSGKTSITPRQGRPNQALQPAQTQRQFAPETAGKTEKAPAAQTAPAPAAFDSNNVNPAVLQSNNLSQAANKPATGSLDNEATEVKRRELYRLEIWRHNQRQSVEPIYQPQITIGRKSQKIASDIQLADDPEISRPHAVLSRDSSGKFWLIHKGKNPTLVNGREAAPNHPFPVAPGETISIGSYLLRIQI